VALSRQMADGFPSRGRPDWLSRGPTTALSSRSILSSGLTVGRWSDQAARWRLGSSTTLAITIRSIDVMLSNSLQGIGRTSDWTGSRPDGQRQLTWVKNALSGEVPHSTFLFAMSFSHHREGRCHCTNSGSLWGFL